ncbi:MAG: hypothetical protein Q4G46_12095 [Propionibacteriaceae bacterium]|nr:hypothetical protein [Propionibacteriaceae bacterium]
MSDVSWAEDLFGADEIQQLCDSAEDVVAEELLFETAEKFRNVIAWRLANVSGEHKAVTDLVVWIGAKMPIELAATVLSLTLIEVVTNQLHGTKLVAERFGAHEIGDLWADMLRESEDTFTQLKERNDRNE